MNRRNLSRVAIRLSILLLLVFRAIAADDSWPQYAHDGARSGRTALKGDIAAPRESWSISLAGIELELEILPASGKNRVTLPGHSSDGTQERAIEPPATPMLDIDGSGTLRRAVETAASRWSKLLPDIPGMQQVRWDVTRTTAKICHLELVAYDDGHDKPRTVWQSAPEETVFAPLCVVYDIDGDGVQEICIAMHYRVLIFEGTTGRKETELRFHFSRSYGWFGLADVDADDQMELVILSDFQSHFDVLEFDPLAPETERLSVKWRRDVETNIEDRIKWPQIGPRPVVDVTGDGRPEIVVNLYNDTGDHAWHIVVLDAASGKPIADLPGRYMHGSADIDGDCDAEIFCTATEGVLIPDFATIEIVDLADEKTSVVWTKENAGFGVADLPNLGATWSTGASLGMRHVLMTEGERPAFLVRSREGVDAGGLPQFSGIATRTLRESRLSELPDRWSGSAVGTNSVSLAAMRYDHRKGIQSLWTVRGLNGNVETTALSTRGDSVSALLRIQFPIRAETTVTADGAMPTVVSRKPLGTGGLAPVAARTNFGGPMHVFVEGAGENVFAIRPPTNGATDAQIVWQRPGRGMGGGLRTGCVALVPKQA